MAIDNETATQVSGALAKLRKMNDERQERQDRQSKGGGYTKVFHSWKLGVNRVRLVGDFVEVKTHYLGSENQTVAIMKSNAFDKKGNDKHIPMIVNCANWDMKNGRFMSEGGTCPICALNRIAKAALKNKSTNGLTEADIKVFEGIKSATSARTSLKWTIIDRDNPNVVKVDETGKETSIPGFKIATITSEIQKGILDIGNQMGDVSDIDSGVDLIVTQSKVNNKTGYTVSASFDMATKSLKVTPLTAEERAMAKVDLDSICGKPTDRTLLIENLAQDYRELLESNDTAPATSNSRVDDAINNTDDDIPF
jgi:hypothetical protein